MHERQAPKVHGIVGLLIFLLLAAAGVFAIITGARGLSGATALNETVSGLSVLLGILVLLAALISLNGMLIVNPNDSRAITLFGRYKGTVRESGWWFINPLSTKRAVTLRVRNFNSERLKVNDASGNPIEIAAVVVFRVVDTYKALFDVDDYNTFVAIQSETALRQLASLYPYDSWENGEQSLRENPDEVAEHLRNEVQQRLAVAGVEVLEARLTHLAYSPEIAGAMLQRQQASAILAARQKIVEGAVGMVQMAVEQLSDAGTVELDEERKAAMINNLMVAIISERAVQPVINTGTLYT